MTDRTDDDLRAPILPGEGASDYERYLRTDELLSLAEDRPRSASTTTSCCSRPSTSPRSCG